MACVRRFPKDKNQIGAVLCLVTGFLLGVQLVALAKELSDAELAEKLHLKPGQEIVRKNGKRVLMMPLDDEAVDKLIKVRAQVDKMEKMMEGVPKRDPRHAKSEKTYWTGREQMSASNFDSAIKFISQYIDEFKKESAGMKDEKQDEHDYYLAWGYQCRGFCYLHNKLLEKGVQDLNEAIKLRPRYAPNYANRAKAYRLMGNLKLAQEDEAKMRSLPPSTGNGVLDLQHEFPPPAKTKASPSK